MVMEVVQQENGMVLHQHVKVLSKISILTAQSLFTQRFLAKHKAIIYMHDWPSVHIILFTHSNLVFMA